MNGSLLQSGVTLVGLLIAVIGSFLLFKNSANPSPFGEEGRALVPRNPNERIQEFKRARRGFFLVLVGFLLQSIGVALPLIVPLPKPESSRITSQPPKEAVVHQRLPSATEVFTLRSKCNELGEKILEENPVGSALSQSQVSHYDINSGRCYVEVTVQTADTTVPMKVLRRYLFDGQTRDLLASQTMENGQKGGIVYNKGILGFERIGEYMDKMMSDQ